MNRIFVFMSRWFYIDNRDVFCPPQLSGLIFFTPLGARVILLHSNVLYNTIKFVTGGRKKHWGGGGETIDPIIVCRILGSPSSGLYVR